MNIPAAWCLMLMAGVLPIAGCNGLGPPISSGRQSLDPEITRLAASIGDRSSMLYGSLPGKTAPDCSFSAKESVYAAMKADAAALQARVPLGDGPLRRTAASVVSTVDRVSLSHEKASANTGDRFGACLAPGAITLNADAIARATKAVEDVQQARSR
jgi:hypothetical protein